MQYCSWYILVCTVWSVNDVHCNPAQVRRGSRQGKSCNKNRITVIKKVLWNENRIPVTNAELPEIETGFSLWECGQRDILSFSHRDWVCCGWQKTHQKTHLWSFPAKYTNFSCTSSLYMVQSILPAKSPAVHHWRTIPYSYYYYIRTWMVRPIVSQCRKLCLAAKMASK